MTELELMTAETTHPEQVISRETVSNSIGHLSLGLNTLASAVNEVSLKHLDEALHHAVMQLRDTIWEARVLHRAELQKGKHQPH